jgi:pimeloyl-ACP methyl ester carboxylesterase
MHGGAFTVDRADGRRLECWASSRATEDAVLFHVGTPAAGIPFAPLVDDVVRRGCRFVTYSRPGYAGSTRSEGRTVADCADDVAAIAEAISLARIHCVGWSGGGPHAVACAALLRDRVVSVATLAGVAPWVADGFDWLDGMAEENHEEFGAAAESPDALRRFLEPRAEARVDVTAEALVDGLGGLLTPVDRAAMTGPFAEYLAASNRAAVSSGFWGWYDDDLAFARDWGFALDAVDVPLTVWHGRHDSMVPPAHGAWLAAHVPGAEHRFLEDEGHLSLVLRLGEVVDELLA